MSSEKQKEYCRRYEQKDPERRREQKRLAARRWYAKNKDLHKQRTKKCDLARKARDPEKFAEQSRKYSEKSRRKKGMKPKKKLTDSERKAANYAAVRSWAKENPEKHRRIANNWRKQDRQKNPEKYALEEKRRRCRNPQRLKDNNLRAKHRRRSKLENLSDIDTVAWKKVLVLFDYKCLYCRDEANTLDHVVPEDRGGTNHITNCVPACKRCNSSKGNRDLLVWLTDYRIAKDALSRPYDWVPVEHALCGRMKINLLQSE